MINQVHSTLNKSPFDDVNSQNNIERYYLPGEFQNDEYVSEEKKEKRAKLAAKISISTIVASFGTLALMKGLPKNTYKVFDNVKNFIESKFKKFGAEVKTEKLNDKYNQAMEKVNAGVEKSKWLNNLGWIKDVLFKKMMYWNKYTARLHDKISLMFEKVTLKTVNSAYKKSNSAFYDFFGMLDDAAMRIKKGKGVGFDEAVVAEKRKILTTSLAENFGEWSRSARHQRMREGAENIENLFLEEFKSKKAYKASIAEEILQKNKDELAAPLKAARQALAGQGETVTEGTIKEILDMYKPYLSEAEYLKLEAAANKAIKKLDKAINVDTHEFFDKYRDIKLGSGPTDLVSLLASFGSIGLGMTFAEDKDERYSILLNVGLPIISSVATTIYFTTRLVSGFKALAIGAIAGIPFSILGPIIDKKRKEISVPSPMEMLTSNAQVVADQMQTVLKTEGK